MNSCNHKIRTRVDASYQNSDPHNIKKLILAKIVKSLQWHLKRPRIELAHQKYQ